MVIQGIKILENGIIQYIIIRFAISRYTLTLNIS